MLLLILIGILCWRQLRWLVCQLDHLMLLLAAFNRLVRLPAQTVLDPEEVVAAFPALFDMIEKLVKGLPVEKEALTEALSECRATLV